MEQLRELAARRQTARDLRLPGADLRGASLGGLRAESLDLEEADLRGTVLTAARWRGCTLRDARLDGSDWTDAVLRMCDLDGARSANAVFIRARLENCLARGTRFDRADFTGAVLTDTDFSRASLRGAILEDVSATGADFRGADLRNARLGGADLSQADFRGADLTGAVLDGAVLDGADLTGAVGPVADPFSTETPVAPIGAEMQALTGAMAPLVLEVLRAARQQGALDEASAQRLADDVHRYAAPAASGSDADALAEAAEKFGAGDRSNLGDLVASMFPPSGSEWTADMEGLVQRMLGLLRGPASGEPPEGVKVWLRSLFPQLDTDDPEGMERLLESLSGPSRRRDGESPSGGGP